jgi:hypothetical protein
MKIRDRFMQAGVLIAICCGWLAVAVAQAPPNKIPPPPVFDPAPPKRTTGLENKPVRTLPLSSNAVGTLTPASGKWHSFVTVKGPNFAKAERVAVIWYPNDDATQAQAGSITATLRKRTGTDEVEIEMPRDAGGTSGGVVRVYLYMPAQLQPVLAGRFTVVNQPAVLRPGGAPKPVLEQVIAITTQPLQLTGKRLATLNTSPGREFASSPIAMTTPALQLMGKRIATLGISPGRELASPPIVVITPALQMTGKRIPSLPAGSVNQRDRALTVKPPPR